MAEFDKDKKQTFIDKGKMVENSFSDLFKNASFPTKGQDLIEHWDVSFETKVDVKGLKKVKRENDEVNEHIHWIEIKGITGELGWLYGKADYFAFELKSYWVIVKKEDLQEFVKQNIEKSFVEQPTLYKLYRRKERKDVLTLITSYDLCFLSSKIIKKQ